MRELGARNSCQKCLKKVVRASEKQTTEQGQAHTNEVLESGRPTVKSTKWRQKTYGTAGKTGQQIKQKQKSSSSEKNRRNLELSRFETTNVMLAVYYILRPSIVSEFSPGLCQPIKTQFHSNAVLVSIGAYSRLQRILVHVYRRLMPMRCTVLQYCTKAASHRYCSIHVFAMSLPFSPELASLASPNLQRFIAGKSTGNLKRLFWSQWACRLLVERVVKLPCESQKTTDSYGFSTHKSDTFISSNTL